MKKYIDADKLITNLRREKHELELSIQSQGDYEQSCSIVAYENILSIITSLQQEQSEQTCKNCGFHENNCPFIRGKLIPYPNKVCNDYTYSVMKEQPEVDLEEDIITIHLGKVLSEEQYNEVVRSIVSFLNIRWPGLLNNQFSN